MTRQVFVSCSAFGTYVNLRHIIRVGMKKKQRLGLTPSSPKSFRSAPGVGVHLIGSPPRPSEEQQLVGREIVSREDS